MNDIILSAKKIHKSYHDGTAVIDVLRGVDMQVSRGNRIAIIGPSGSGKSTLLHILGGLDKPSQGEVCMHHHNWAMLNEKKRCQLRNQHLGFVYQFHHLLPEFTALENVALPLLIAGMSVKHASAEAALILNRVGLAPRQDHKPAQLSGGERQRVAIARALIHKPHCVLADEPTGNLDQATAAQVWDLMLGLNQQLGTALVIVTHDQQLAQRMDTVCVLSDGMLGPV